MTTKSECACGKTCVCYRLGHRIGHKEGKLKARAEVRAEKDHQYHMSVPNKA